MIKLSNLQYGVVLEGATPALVTEFLQLVNRDIISDWKKLDAQRYF